METVTQKKPRIEVVDSLRGFAIFSILLVHSVEHFLYSVYPETTTLPQWLNILDQFLFTSTYALFEGKAYAIFALLFGFTFYIQYTNQKIKGHDFGPRFLFRLMWLLLFATINAAFFPGGDVLMLFCCVGWLLFIVRKWSNKGVFILSLILLSQPIEWFHAISDLIIENYQPVDFNLESLAKELALPIEQGNFLEMIYKNITLGQKSSLLWALQSGRLTQIGGLFLLGLIIGRKELFLPTAENNIIWNKILIISAILFGLLVQLKSYTQYNFEQSIAQKNFYIILDMWQKICFTFVLLSSFIWFYQREKFQQQIISLKYYGKMSLTNYISQSAIGAILFFPFGLNLAIYCGYTLSLIIACVFFAFQVTFCKWWLSFHKQGPLESIWHTLTWLKWNNK